MGLKIKNDLRPDEHFSNSKNNNKEKKSSVFDLISVLAEVQIHDIGIGLD